MRFPKEKKISFIFAFPSLDDVTAVSGEVRAETLWYTNKYSTHNTNYKIHSE